MEIVLENDMTVSTDIKVIWQSLYGLMDSPDSSESWNLSVTGFNDLTVSIDVAQPVEDIHKEFVSVSAAYSWLMEFTEGKHLELDDVCVFDFREMNF